jgi:23S rRNA (adenine2030-N6)-methyltransferase
MLSYRHGFHAGNHADVFKHIVLVFCLDYLAGKEKPLLCVDTHAGAGVYDLEEGRNREWEGGIGKLTAAALPPMAARYLEVAGLAGAAASGGKARVYPGSPLITASLLRKQDRLVCCELHPADYKILEAALNDFGASPERRDQAPVVETRREDGPASLKALLPPPSRRGLILIDPSWEEKDEYETIPQALSAAVKRFPQGMYILWYPLLAVPKTAAGEMLPETLMGLYGGNRCRAELRTAKPAGQQRSWERSLGGRSPRGMYGSGLVVFNPPYTLKAALEGILPWLAETLGVGGSGRLEWIGTKQAGATAGD